MIRITDLQYFVDTQQAFRILKPWWDVVTEYICIVMLMISVFGGTLQVTQDNMICFPCKWVVNETCKNFNSTLTSSLFTEPKGIQCDLDPQQHSYIDAVCYENGVHLFVRYFPYLVLLHTLISLACSNFWFKFPKTSSKLEYFVSILLECIDSPWTTRAPSETVVVGAGFPMLQRTKSSFGVLDKKECEQAKDLFEKVKKFRRHMEKGEIVYRLYIYQTFIKVIISILIPCCILSHMSYIKFSVDCSVNTESLTGYRVYRCAYTLATIFQNLAWFYISLVVLYIIICIYSLYWMLYQHSLKMYNFESVQKESSYSVIRHAKNDFAFMLHMIDQYDPRYSKCFAMFLSELSENELRWLSEWPLDDLRQSITKNSEERLELHLSMLGGIPDPAFDLMKLEVLELELIPDVTIPSIITQLINLREMCLYHTPAKIKEPALDFLCENLKSLRIKFTDNKEIPSWIFSLNNLRELHLTGNLSADNDDYIVTNEIRKLKKLKVLCLNCNLTELPQAVTDVGMHLQKLSINNNSTKLIMPRNLKKMVNLRELELTNCGLESIPDSILGLPSSELVCLKLQNNQIADIPKQINTLTNLEELYLNRNRIRKIPMTLFSCCKLRFLDLSHNNVTNIPKEISKLQNLHSLAVTANKIKSLPNELFQISTLRTLKLEEDSVQSLPPQSGEFTGLVVEQEVLNTLPTVSC